MAGGEARNAPAFNNPTVTVPAADDYYFDLDIDEVSEVRYCEFVYCGSTRPQVRRALIHGSCPESVAYSSCEYSSE